MSSGGERLATLGAHSAFWRSLNAFTSSLMWGMPSSVISFLGTIFSHVYLGSGPSSG